MIDSGITKGLNELFHTSTGKRIPADLLFSTARDRSLSQDSDLAVEKKLLKILEQFAQGEVIKLPSAKGKKWDTKSNLPHYVTLINTAEDIRRKRNKHSNSNYETQWVSKLQFDGFDKCNFSMLRATGVA